MPPASCSNWARCSKVSRSEKGAGRLSAMLPPAYAVLRLRPTAGRLSRGARPSFRSLLFSACGQPRLECLRTADHSISMSDSWFEPDPIRSAIYRLPAIGNFLLWFRYWFGRSEEHTSELQTLMRTSYAVFCLKKKNKKEEK